MNLKTLSQSDFPNHFPLTITKLVATPPPLQRNAITLFSAHKSSLVTRYPEDGQEMGNFMTGARGLVAFGWWVCSWGLGLGYAEEGDGIEGREGKGD
jgi:hypothetical protein